MNVIIKGKIVVIDENSLPLLNSRVWHINDNGYLVWRGMIDGFKKTIRFHREVIKAKEGQIVDHINRNKLDNRFKNLRLITFAENIRNSDKYDSAKGYYFDSRKQRWIVDFKRIGIRYLIVDSEEDAKQFVADSLNGKTPIRKFTRRMSLGGAKLTPENRKTIDKLFSEGFKRYEIAKNLNISASAVGRYLSGITWHDPNRKYKYKRGKSK